MSMLRKIVIASGNEHKVSEFQSILKPLGIKVVPYKEVVAADFVMPEETGATFEENSVIKAEAIAKATGMPVFADDSGFCVKVLGDFPGVRSARFVEEMGGCPQAFAEIEKRLGGKYADAQFVCVIAFVDGKGAKTQTFRGVCNGFVTFPARGESGFGYDPIFVPNSFGETFAEMGEEAKNAISHRAAASELFVKYVEELKAEEEANKGRKVTETVAKIDVSEAETADVVESKSVVAGAATATVVAETVSAEVENDVETNVNAAVNAVSDTDVKVEVDTEPEVKADVEPKADTDVVTDVEVEPVAVVRKNAAKGKTKETSKTKPKSGMAAFLDVDTEFDAPAVPFSSDDDGKEA